MTYRIETPNVCPCGAAPTRVKLRGGRYMVACACGRAVVRRSETEAVRAWNGGPDV